MPDNACTLVPTVFRWHAKMEFKFHFYFSFSRDIEKQIWILLFVFRFRLNFEKPIWTSYFVFRFRITSKNGYEFRFSFSHYFEKRIWISFLYGLLLKNRSEFRLSFLHDLKNGSLHQSSHLRSPDMHTLGVDRGIHFLCKWKQVNFTLPGAKVRSELPPPPPPSWYVLQTWYSLF